MVIKVFMFFKIDLLARLIKSCYHTKFIGHKEFDIQQTIMLPHIV